MINVLFKNNKGAQDLINSERCNESSKRLFFNYMEYTKRHGGELVCALGRRKFKVVYFSVEVDKYEPPIIYGKKPEVCVSYDEYKLLQAINE